MSNWQNWYQNFRSKIKEKEMKAFLKAMNGEKFEDNEKIPLDVNTKWSDFLINVSSIEEHPKKVSDNRLRYDNSDINTAILKSIKILREIYLYPNDILETILFNNIQNDLSASEIIKLLREPPTDWFLICTNCEHENLSGWLVCSNCKKTIEDVLEQ
jgi:hypothetical protein